MSQPTQYNRLYNFVTYALANPSATYQPAYTDAEFNAIQLTLSQVLTNLTLTQRDDGALKNGIVTQDSLSTTLAALFAVAGSTIRGAWLTATAYALKDVVTQGGVTYLCAVAHTSGTFAADLTAVKWVALGSGSSIAAANVASTPSGDVAATNVDAAIAELASEKLAKAQNLSDLASRATAFTNLVAPGGTMTAALAFSGARLNEAQGADIASSGTINLDTATGNVIDVTGTTTINVITLSQGREATVRFTGALTLTHGASLVLPGAANIITAAGDFALFRGYAAGVVRCVMFSQSPFTQAGTGALSRSLAGKAREAVSITDFMTPAQIADFAAGTMTLDLSAPIQLAANSGATAILTPAGTALIGTPILSPSNVRWYGTGGGSKWRAKSTLTALAGWPTTVYALLANADIATGNTDIVAENMSFDMTDRDVAGAHCVHFRKCTNSHVRNCSTRYGDDGVAMTLATRCSIDTNVGFNHANAAFDMWETTIDSFIVNNTIYGDATGRGQQYGILVTGLTILDIAATSARVQVTGNRISGVQMGIWIQGGVVGAQTGTVNDCVVQDNIISNMISYSGIRLSEGSGHLVSGNRIVTTWTSGIQVQGEAGGGTSGAAQNCIISDNYLTGINQSGNAGIDAIQISNSGNGTIVHGNSVAAGSQKYSLSFGSTVSGCRHNDNLLGAGATGVLNDAAGVNSAPQFTFANSAGTAPGMPGPTDIPFATAIFNQGAGFATPTFTAPRTGKYQFEWHLTHTNGCTAGNVFEISLVTTARTYTWSFTVAAAENTLQGSVLADMTATDTAKLQITRTTGAGTFTLVATAAKNMLSGFLRQEYV